MLHFKATVYVVEHTEHTFVAVNVFTYALNIPECNERAFNL